MPGDIFLRTLKLIIIPLIAASIITGLCTKTNSLTSLFVPQCKIRQNGGDVLLLQEQLRQIQNQMVK